MTLNTTVPTTTTTVQVAKIPWWKSKTLWLNLILALIAITEGALGKEWIPVEYQVVIATILNAIVRFLTTQPIQGGQDSKAPVTGITTTTVTPITPVVTVISPTEVKLGTTDTQK